MSLRLASIDPREVTDPKGRVTTNNKMKKIRNEDKKMLTDSILPSGFLFLGIMGKISQHGNAYVHATRN